MYEKLGRSIYRHRGLVLVVLAALTVAAASTLPSIRFDFTPQALFEQRNEANAFARAIRVTFGDDTNTLIILWHTESTEALFAPASLDDIQHVTEELEGWERAVKVTSLSNMHLPRNGLDASGELTLNLGPLVGDAPTSSADAAAVRAAVLGEPLLERVLISADEASTALVIELDQEARRINDLVPLLEEVHAMLDGWQGSLASRPRLVLSGLPTVRVEIVQALQHEQVRFLPLTALLMCILMAWMFRRMSGVLLPIGSIALALIWTGAMLAILDAPLNIINSVLPTLLMIIGLSDGIHLLSRAAEEASAGYGQEQVVVRAVHRMGLACLLTSLTTAIGFASLVTSRTDILKEFGLETAAGVMLAYVATILFIPAMLTWMRPPVRGGLHQAQSGLIERLMGNVSVFVRAFPKRCLAGGLALGVFCGLVAWQWGRIDSRLLEVFPKGHPTAELTREVEETFTGVLPLMVSVEARQPDYFLDPGNLAKLEELQRVVEASDQEMILKTGSVVELLQVFRAAYLAEPELRGTPFDSREQIQTILRLYRQDAAADVARTLDDENRHALITIRLKDLGILRGIEMVRSIAREGDRIFGEGTADGVLDARASTKDTPVNIRLAGDTYLASIGLLNFIYDLLSSLGLASVLIFAMMTLLFRSLRLGLIAVLPNVLPLVCTAGWMAARGIELNTSTVIIFSISLGLAVDDTIHFLTRYQEERHAGLTVDEAIHRTFLGAGRAIVITSVVLLCGVTVLLTTDFMPTRYFAELTGCTVVGAILGDLFLLPACLILFDGDTTAATPG